MRFQWLKDYQELDEQLLYLKWNLNKSQLELNRWIEGDLSKVKIDKNSRSASLEINIERIKREILRLEGQKSELTKLINSFSGIDNEIVRLKYVDNLTLEEIAEVTGYSASYIRKKHSDIRSILKFVDDYESRRCERENKLNEIDYYSNKINQDKQLRLF
ncbi:hypothetical protein ACWOAH_09905 [Vagococcus vulneris]|uniref:RNA polymerase sigma-70 region 4 domain-containing protein n=1 Tax=Vagococcus vulneris TaxID=1977869 RepID=A0A429ZWS3_9ENTE|nr:hypothetical protein [Vagococcus vulneris]RST98272.1 hypothetical protein CBF37_08140 [Vagococcus vulneris]